MTAARLRLVAVDGVTVDEGGTPACPDCGGLYATEYYLAMHACPERRRWRRFVTAVLLLAFVSGAALAPLFLRG